MATLGLKVRPDSADFPVTWFVPVLILGVPIFDTTLVSISRSRRGLLPFTSPGKDHTAHRLSNLGLGHRGAVLVMYAVAAVFGSLALLIQRISPAATYAVVGVVVLLAFVAILYLENLPYERQVKVAKPAV
jgi:UDP-GlcNAc:undecaprenyl-phosphate/decaprenyl-phosphate GlcNAc-1-phosphate transferase